MKPFIHYWKKFKNSYFILLLASFLWVLFRTGTKPSRIQYPCQKAAITNLGLFASMFSLAHMPKIKESIKNSSINKEKIIKYSLMLICFLLLFTLIDFGINKYQVAKSWEEYEQSLNTLQGISSYQTIPAAMDFTYPNRVVSVHDSNATTWTGSDHPYDSMNQTEIDKMVEKGVMELTGENNPHDAWATLIPYNIGEAVAIKVNFNNAGDCSTGFTSNSYMNPYPKLINSVIEGLKSIGVPSDKIWITDPSRPVTDAFRNQILDKNVQYYTKCSSTYIQGRTNVFTTDYVNDGSSYSTQIEIADGVFDWVNPADVFVNAAHIINMPQLKGHGGSSITLGLKNNFGSVDFTEYASGTSNLHEYFYQSGSAYSTDHNLLADINKNPVFANKIRLILGDGLMGHPTLNYVNPVLWQSFGNNPPEILFFGVDPVAVDSVMFDYLQRECNVKGYAARNDDILRYAATQGLGVFEHWNSDSARQYTQIDYVEIDLDKLQTPECSDLIDNDGDGQTDFPNDVGCTSEEDVDESNCGDGVCEGGETCLSCSADCVADSDGDTYNSIICGGLDCDDSNPNIHPNANENCANAVDDNCNSQIDCLDSLCSSDPSCQSAPVCGENIGLLFHFDQASSVLTDDSGNKNDGVISGATFTSAGRYNGAFNFDGTNDFARINEIDFSGTDKLTVSFWVKPNVAISSNKMLIELTDNMNAYSDGFYINVDAGGFSTGAVKGNVGYNSWNMNTHLKIGEWNHIVYVFDKGLSSGEVKGYYNGVLDGSTFYASDNTNSFFGTRPLYFASRGGTLEFFNGAIDDVAIWKRVLTSSEISNLYNSGSPVSCGDLNECSVSGSSCDDYQFCTINDICVSGECVGESINVDDGVSCTTDSCDETNNLIMHTPGDLSCSYLNDETHIGYCDANLGCLTSEIEENPPVEDSSLILWFSFNNDLLDSSSNGNDGYCTSTSCPVLTSGNISGAYNFDGSNDYAKTESVAVDYRKGLTISTWIRPETTSGKKDILTQRNDWGNDGYILRLDGGQLVFAYFDSEWRYHYSGLYPTPNQWNFVAVSFDGKNSYVYLNNQVRTISFNYALSQNFDRTFQIGRHAYNTNFFDGTIDEVRVYNRSLSGSEIEKLYLGKTAGCLNNLDCSDGLFCNGVEICNLGNCVAGSSPVVNDNVACTTDSCNEVNDVIVHTPQNSLCSDNLFCNGNEVCDVSLGCQGGSSPVVNDNVACTTDSCNEVNDVIVHTPQNSLCSDNLFCNGNEVCDVSLGCQGGSSPVINDNVACTTDSCNEVNDAVIHLADDSTCSYLDTETTVGYCDLNLGCLSSQIEPPLVDRSLVLWLPFDGDTLDSSGENNNAYCNDPACPSLTLGHSNGAYNFEGINDYVKTESVAVDYTNGLTITAWINPETNSGKRYDILTQRDNNGNEGYILRIEDGELVFAYYDLGWHYHHTEFYPPVNEWSFIAVSYDGVNSVIYVNDISTISPFNYNLYSNLDRTFQIGRNAWNVNYFDGSIDEVQVYNRALSNEEISSVYQN